MTHNYMVLTSAAWKRVMREGFKRARESSDHLPLEGAVWFELHVFRAKAKGRKKKATTVEA